MRRLLKMIRNLLLLVIAAIIVLAGVLLFNVVTHGRGRSRSPPYRARRSTSRARRRG